MTSFKERVQFYDPTAGEAINGFVVESSLASANIEPMGFRPGDLKFRAAALSRLKLIFPEESKRKPSKQSKEYKSALNQIALGNFSIVDRFEKRKGGV